MVVTACLPRELIPVFDIYADEIGQMPLRQALLHLMNEFPAMDPENKFQFTFRDDLGTVKHRYMTIGLRLRIMYAQFQSRPIMFTYNTGALLASHKRYNFGDEPENGAD